jgi:hypothetical protein
MFIEENQQYKLTLRKKTLFDDLMKRRLKHNSSNSSNNNSSCNSIEQIGSIINEGMSLKKNDLIDKGICLLLKYIDNNENTFHSKQKKYLLENIYYSLLDIFKHYNQYRINILHIFISLTAIDEIFISNLMNDNIISYISPIITKHSSHDDNNDDEYYLTLILLSNCMVDNITNYTSITSSFDFSNIIHNLISSHSSYISDEYGDVETDDLASFIAKLENNITANFLISRCAIGNENTIKFEIYGTDGVMRFNLNNPDELMVCIGEVDRETDSIHTVKVPQKYHIGQEETFINAALGEIPEDFPFVSEGAACQKIVDAILESAETGSVVKVM